MYELHCYIVDQKQANPVVIELDTEDENDAKDNCTAVYEANPCMKEVHLYNAISDTFVVSHGMKEDQ